MDVPLRDPEADVQAPIEIAPAPVLELRKNQTSNWEWARTALFAQMVPEPRAEVGKPDIAVKSAATGSRCMTMRHGAQDTAEIKAPDHLVIKRA